MPTVYRVRCEHCLSHAEPVDAEISSGFAGAALIDDAGSDGVITQGGYRAVIDATGKLDPLLHPVEMSILRAHGMSYLSASVRGRLVQVRQWICEDCGTLYECSDLVFMSYGWGCLLVLSVATVVALLGHTRAALVAALVGPALALGLVPLVGTFLVRRLHAAQRESLQRGPCPACGSSRRVAIHAVGNKKLPCPKCGTRSVTVTFAGIS